MTVATTSNRVSYNGTGALTPLAVSFPFPAQADLVVIETIIATGVQSTLVLTTHYTITGTPDALGHYSTGGTVTPVLAFPVTVRWTIYRDPASTQQEIDLVENDSLPAESVEAAFDYLTMLIQRVSDLITRSLRQPDGDSTSIAVLPSAVGRASTYLGFDASSNPVALAPPTGTTGVSAFMATVLDDASAAAARTTLGITVTSNKDDEFRITGSADTTKKLAFELDTNLSTATTRTVTAQDLDGTMALLGTGMQYNATANLGASVRYADLTGASFTLTLPTVATSTGRIVTFKHIGTSLTQVYTIKGNGAETIENGTNTYLLYTNGERLTLYCHGTAWVVLDHAAQTEWVDAGTMTITGTTSNPTKATTPDYDHVFWRRDGKTAYVKWMYQGSSAAGAADGSGAYLFATPTGIAIDAILPPVATAFATAVMSEAVRSAVFARGFACQDSTALDTLTGFAYDTTHIQWARTSTATPIGSATFAMTTTELGYYLEAHFPAANWRV